MSVLGGIVLQKSPPRSCRIKIRNNRIGANGFLNQRCALTPDLESILRARTGKIVLQHIRWKSGHAADITAKTDFDPQETLAESKSRNAAVSRDAEVCYPFGRKHGKDRVVDRRSFITLVGGTAAAWPLAARAARAQQSGKMPRVGVLVSLSAPHPFTEAFRSGMRDLGYSEGGNVAIEWRYADAQFSRAVELAAELVRLQVDVIAAYHTPAVRAAMNATKTIPIVMAPAGAPLEMGLVESLARPGGNVTGLSNMEAELGGKRLDLLREAIPGLARVAVLAAKTDPFTAPFVQDLQSGAGRVGLQLHPVMVNGPGEFEDGFAAINAAGDQAVIVQPNFLPQTAAIVALAAKHRLAILSSYRDTSRAGGLISYSADHAAHFRRAATFVDKILKGAKPAELPVEQPTKFELVVNLKTAKALGLDVPPTLLARADEVIE